MLEENYRIILDRLIAHARWDIVLPCAEDEFFAKSGTASPCSVDCRRSVRIYARSRGIAYYEQTLPAFPRSDAPQAVYTLDFSKTGIGFLSARPFLPEEHVRILVPTMWVSARIVRCHMWGPHCYSIGGTLNTANQPDPRAFSTSLVARPTMSPHANKPRQAADA